MKFVTTDFGNKKEILKFGDHYVSLGVMVSDTGIAANSDGKKIVTAGTIVGGGSAKPALTNLDAVVSKMNTQGSTGAYAEGVLLNDVDVTYGPAPGAMVLHGYIDLSKLPEAPCADAVAALKQITFMK